MNTLKDKQQNQSQYWVTVGYSPFTSVATWLLVAIQNMITGTLSMGDEVTVDGETAGEEMNTASFLDAVTGVSEAEEDVYDVTNSEIKNTCGPSSQVVSQEQAQCHKRTYDEQ